TAAFQNLRRAHMRLALRASLTQAEGPDSHTRSLGETIEVSVSLLRPEQQQGLAALCALPPKPATFDEDTACAVLQSVLKSKLAALHTLDRLVDAGLVEHWQGAYTIHPAIVDWHTTIAHPINKATYDAARCALVQHMMQVLKLPSRPMQPTDTLTAEQWPLAIAAVQTALELGLPAAADHFVHVLFDRLERYGLRELARQLLDAAAHHHSDDARCAAHLCEHQIRRGQALIWSGDLSASIACLRQAVECARRDAPATLPAALANLARAHLQAGDAQGALNVCNEAFGLEDLPNQPAWQLKVLTTYSAALSHLGLYDQAEEELRQIAALARELNQPAAEIAALINLGILCRQRNRHAEAVGYLEAGLALAREIDFRERMLHALTALGVIALDRGDCAQAEHYYNEALPIAHQLNDLPNIVLLEHALGVLHMRQGKHQQAHTHLLEALTLAERHTLTWYAASVRVELGEWHLEQGQVEQAELVFTRGLEIATERGFTDLAALNRFGLARVCAERGNHSAARQLAQDSRHVLRNLSHYRSDEIAAWIEKLPAESAITPSVTEMTGTTSSAS
ncbi:MAG: tetratricopeptide repeat protein, partial [Anaerolineae bacterium]|nr:tetratricopeptide repeat protein [Thermoflexales bacterium]MDW8408257.1 tetratricopeptide repeat protein [Anaerolineae bacterium]